MSVDTPSAPPPKRDVVFHLTPYAKGCELATVGAPERGLTLGSRRPGQALHALLQRLSLLPGDVEVSPSEENRCAVHHASDPTRIYAFAWAGLSYVEAAQALARLRGDVQS